VKEGNFGSKGENKMEKGAASLAMLLVVLGTLYVSIHVVSAAQISIVPASQTVLANESFTIDIYVDPEGSEVFGAQYELHFNNTLLNATSQAPGTFLSCDGANTYIVRNNINNTVGIVEYGETRTGVTYGVTNSGILATVTFKAIAEEDGISELSFTMAKLSDPYANPIMTETNDGNVSVITGICGDVTGDGRVRVGDGRRILKWIDDPVNYPIDNLWAADVTGDGRVRVGDGRRILKWIDDPDNYPLECAGL